MYICIMEGNGCITCGGAGKSVWSGVVCGACGGTGMDVLNMDEDALNDHAEFIERERKKMFEGFKNVGGFGQRTRQGKSEGWKRTKKVKDPVYDIEAMDDAGLIEDIEFEEV